MGQAISGGKRILVFCRFYLIDDFRANVAPFADSYDFRFLTDGRSPGTPDTRARFYAAWRARERSPEIGPDDEAEVIARCRYLRNIAVESARRQLHAMAISIAEAMDSAPPDAVLSHMVDDYVTHLVSVLAEKRGIRYVSYCFSFFPGHIQLTQSWTGTPLDVRQPEDDEVDEVYRAISERVFRQHYLQAPRLSYAAHVKRVIRYGVKRAAFEVKRWLERDPLNLHYRVTPYLVESRRFSHFPKPSDFAADWRKSLEDLRAAWPGAPVVYLPLPYFPESTIDYWVPNRRILDFDNQIIEMLQALAREGIVLVKEHLHMVGARAPEFYRRIGAIANVVNAHPREFSNDLLVEADAVVLGGGSVGVEATVRGKPVLSYAPNTYWFAPSGAAYLDLDDVASWPAAVRGAIDAFRPLTEPERREFIRACLASTARPRDGSRRWPLVAQQDLSRLLEAA